MAKKASTDDSKIFAFLAVFLSIIGFLVVLLAKKDDKYAMYYAKQSLILFIAGMVVNVAGTFIPIIGWFVILPVGGILVFILWIMALINSVSGIQKPVPIIGKYADKIKL